MKKITKISTQTIKKKKEDMFKKHNFKTIKCNPNDPGFDINKFLGKINSYVTKLRKKSGE